MLKYWRANLIICVLCIGASVCSFAGTNTSEPSPTTLPTQSDIFSKGVWTFETYGSYAETPNGTRGQLYSGTIGIGYCFIPNNTLTSEFNGLYGAQPGQDIAAVGWDLLLRTRLIGGKDWNLFGDFGAGIYEASHRIPPTGTDFNLTFKSGLGDTVRLGGQTYLLSGVRYEHLSNARMDGAARNPSLNAIEGYVGLLFKL
jgi:hypothetical protein